MSRRAPLPVVHVRELVVAEAIGAVALDEAAHRDRTTAAEDGRGVAGGRGRAVDRGDDQRVPRQLAGESPRLPLRVGDQLGGDGCGVVGAVGALVDDLHRPAVAPLDRGVEVVVGGRGRGVADRRTPDAQDDVATDQPGSGGRLPRRDVGGSGLAVDHGQAERPEDEVGDDPGGDRRQPPRDGGAIEVALAGVGLSLQAEHPRHADKPAHRQRADAVFGVTPFEAHHPGAEAHEELVDPDPGELGEDEVAALVDHHHDGDEHQEGDDRDEEADHAAPEPPGPAGAAPAGRVSAPATRRRAHASASRTS